MELHLGLHFPPANLKQDGQPLDLRNQLSDSDHELSSFLLDLAKKKEQRSSQVP